MLSFLATGFLLQHLFLEIRLATVSGLGFRVSGLGFRVKATMARKLTPAALSAGFAALAAGPTLPGTRFRT